MEFWQGFLAVVGAIVGVGIGSFLLLAILYNIANVFMGKE